MLAKILRFSVLAFAAIGMLVMPSTSNAGQFCDWFSGNSPNQTVMATYTPPYYDSDAPAYPTASYAAPSSCSSCAQPVAQYSPYTAGYTPYTTYRPITVAKSVTAYYPTPVYGAYVAPPTYARPVTAYYAPTTYSAYYGAYARPVTAYYAPTTAYYTPVAWTQQVRMIPYTTYRMSSMPVTYFGYAVPMQAPSSCSSCQPSIPSYGCSSCGQPSYSTSSCSPCQSVVSSTYSAPIQQSPISTAPASPAIPVSPSSTSADTAPSMDATQQPAIPKTFKEQKPVLEENHIPPVAPTTPADARTDNSENAQPQDKGPKPAQQPGTQLNSLPDSGPQLIDSSDRTTSNENHSAVHLAARPIVSEKAVPAQSPSGWRESKD